jgi:hypothetical protein
MARQLYQRFVNIVRGHAGSAALDHYYHDDSRYTLNLTTGLDLWEVGLTLPTVDWRITFLWRQDETQCKDAFGTLGETCAAVVLGYNFLYHHRNDACDHLRTVDFHRGTVGVLSPVIATPHELAGFNSLVLQRNTCARGRFGEVIELNATHTRPDGMHFACQFGPMIRQGLEPTKCTYPLKVSRVDSSQCVGPDAANDAASVELRRIWLSNWNRDE